jgi:hypothetical protein
MALSINTGGQQWMKRSLYAVPRLVGEPLHRFQTARMTNASPSSALQSSGAGAGMVVISPPVTVPVSN